MANKNFGLGKGLDALFIDNTSETGGAISLPVNEIETNKNQPRKHFDPEALSSLAESIREHGVLQPVVVRAQTDGSYLLVAGERRWRAAKMLGLVKIPAIVKELSDIQSAQIALVENLQREDLNPVEEAMGYKELADSFGLNQEEISQKVSKSRSAVANSLRLLTLPASILEMVSTGELSAGHARALLGAEIKEDLESLAGYTFDQRLSVRETEDLIRHENNKNGVKKKRTEKSLLIGGNTFYTELEIALRDETGRKVHIKHSGGDKGSITIEFFSKEDAEKIAAILSKNI